MICNVLWRCPWLAACFAYECCEGVLAYFGDLVFGLIQLLAGRDRWRFVLDHLVDPRGSDVESGRLWEVGFLGGR